MGRSGRTATDEWETEPRAGYDVTAKVAENPVRILFRASDRVSRLPVTITVCRTLLDDDARTRFVNDCTAIARLGARPDCLAPLDFGFDPSGQPYVVTEELPAGSLADEIRQAPLPWRDAVAIGARMAEVLASAHRRGVVHGDVAPIRIRRDSTGRPKLEGLAIARIECGMRMRASSPMALQHLAPEVLRGGPATGAADVYSVASTTFALGTGAGPFAPRDGEHPHEWIARIEGERPDLRADGIPASLVPVLEGALAKDPATRPKSVAAFAQQLRAVQDGRAVPSAAAAAAAAAATHARPRLPGRGPRAVVLLAGIIALCAVAFVISQSSDDDRSVAAPRVTVPAASLIREVEGFALGPPLDDETRTELGQDLFPGTGTRPPSTVLAGRTFFDPVNEGSAIAFAVGPPRARATIPFRGPSDCTGTTETLADQPVCVTDLGDGSTLLRWGGTDVWLGVVTEQPDLGASVMAGLVAADLARLDAREGTS